MAGIQFFGVTEVIEAYADYEVECWAVFEGKELIRSGDDSETLSRYLTKLQVHGSAATYTLKVYRSVEDCDAIGQKTECSGQFKFKLNEGGQVSGSGITRYGGVDPITARLQGIVAEEVGKVFDKKLNRDDDDDKPGTFMEGLIGLINQPDKLIATLQGIQGLFVPRDTLGHQSTPYAAVAGPGFSQPRRTGVMPMNGAAPVTEPVGTPGLTAEQEQQMEEVALLLDRWEKADPNVLPHLRLLVDLAEKQPGIYAMAVAQLKSMSK